MPARFARFVMRITCSSGTFARLHVNCAISASCASSNFATSPGLITLPSGSPISRLVGDSPRSGRPGDDLSEVKCATQVESSSEVWIFIPALKMAIFGAPRRQYTYKRYTKGASIRAGIKIQTFLSSTGILGSAAQCRPSRSDVGRADPVCRPTAARYLGSWETPPGPRGLGMI